MNTATAPPRPSGNTAGVVPDVRSALDALVAADLGVVERDELHDLVSTATRVRGWLDSFDVGCTRRARELAAAGAAEPAESLLGGAGKRTHEEASRIGNRARALDEFGGADNADSTDIGAGRDPEPEADSFERALRDGRIAGGHVDAISQATRRLESDARTEFQQHLPTLLTAALAETVEAFARRCNALARRIVACQATSDADELDRQRRNSTVKRWVDKITGMHHTKLELDPIRDAQLWSIINARLASMMQADGNAKTPWMQMQVDAFIAATTASAAASAASSPEASSPAGSANDSYDRVDEAAHERRVPEITVLLDYHTLLHGLHRHSTCETDDGITLPVSTVRRLCCDAEIIPIVLGADGIPLDAGRSVRTATRQQRRALRAMHRTCAHPDCTVAFSACKAHHIRWWWRDLGPTDLDNLLPLCERHHHLVHEGGWTLTMTADRTATWTRPDGTIAHTGTTIDRTPPPAPAPARTPGDRPTSPPI